MANRQEQALWPSGLIISNQSLSVTTAAQLTPGKPLGWGLGSKVSRPTLLRAKLASPSTGASVLLSAWQVAILSRCSQSLFLLIIVQAGRLFCFLRACNRSIPYARRLHAQNSMLTYNVSTGVAATQPYHLNTDWRPIRHCNGK